MLRLSSERYLVDSLICCCFVLALLACARFFFSTAVDALPRLSRSLTFNALFLHQGKCLLSLGKPQEAVAAFTFGLVKEPGNAAAKADRTTAEQCIGRIALAKQVRKGCHRSCFIHYRNSD